MTAAELFQRATAMGLRIEPRGDKLAVIPADRVPSEFAALLREHKRELLNWLQARGSNVPLDCVPWLYIARQILAGEFDDADGSTRESLRIGLCSIKGSICQDAAQRLVNKVQRP
jgi:hypothetical protein